MPLVTVKGVEGVFNEQQKSEILQKITDVMVSVEGENMRSVTWVIFEEVKSGDWSIGGTPLTTENVLKLQSGEIKSL